MSGRVINGGRGGSGYTGRGYGCGCGRGQNYSGASNTSKKSICTDLGNNVFDYVHKAEADQMITSWENLVHHIDTKYGQDISNDLNKKTKVNFVTPVH